MESRKLWKALYLYRNKYILYIYIYVFFSKYSIYMYISELCFVSYRAVRIKICLKDNLLHSSWNAR